MVMKLARLDRVLRGTREEQELTCHAIGWRRRRCTSFSHTISPNVLVRHPRRAIHAQARSRGSSCSGTRPSALPERRDELAALGQRHGVALDVTRGRGAR
jgi:hypothetical protein